MPESGEDIELDSYRDRELVASPPEGDGPAGSAGFYSVYAFEITSEGKRVRTQKVISSDNREGDRFGVDLSMTHDTIVIGAPWSGPDFSNRGAAYVFKRTASGWVERQKLIAHDSDPGDGFGTGVAIDNRMIVIGAPGHRQEEDETGQRVAGGAAYIFTSLSLSNFVLMAGIPDDFSPPTTLLVDRVNVYDIRPGVQ